MACKSGVRRPFTRHDCSAGLQSSDERIESTGAVKLVAQALAVPGVSLAAPVFCPGFNVFPSARALVVPHERAIVVVIAQPEVDTRCDVLPIDASADRPKIFRSEENTAELKS